MASSKIDELQRKLKSDPDSAVFVALADEYTKEGLIDDAIETLKDGLFRAPHYVSAMVALGNLYAQKGMFLDARDEFENIVIDSPDNIYAHRKLAKIYSELGEDGKALAQYDIVLTLSPDDEEAFDFVTQMRGDVVNFSSGSYEPMIDDSQSYVAFDEFDEDDPNAITFVEEPGQVEDMIFTSEPVMIDDSKVDQSTMDVEQSAMDAQDIADENTDSTKPEPPVIVPITKINSQVHELRAANDEHADLEKVLQEAEQFVLDGKLEMAMDLYMRILYSEPENLIATQKSEELRMLMSMTRPRKPASELPKVVSACKRNVVDEQSGTEDKLLCFLDAIKRRRDEFLRSP